MNTSERIRVLHVIQNLNYGGMERLLSDIVRGLDPDRFESHILVLQYVGRFGEGLGEYARVHVAPPMSRASMVRPSALAATIRRIAPDVVHSHSGVWYKASLAARMAGVPMVIHTEHGRPVPDPWQARWLDGMASRRTDIAVAVSSSVSGTLTTDVVRRKCEVRTIINGVDTNRFRPEPDSGMIRRQLGIPADAPVIGSIGRLEWIKGYDVMIDAFARLVTSRDWERTPRLVLAGDGSERPHIEAQIRQSGLGGLVCLVGWRDDVHDLLSSFDCFCMSSRSEGTSVSLLEAMSSGVCPVVTDVGGNRAVLGPKLSHRLVPAADPERLSNALNDAIVDPARRKKDSEYARHRVEHSFGVETMIRAYGTLYQAAAERISPTLFTCESLRC